MPVRSNVVVGDQSHKGTTEPRKMDSKLVLHQVGDTQGCGAFVLGSFPVSMHTPFHLVNNITQTGRVRGPVRGWTADISFDATGRLQNTKETKEDVVVPADFRPVSVFYFPTLSLHLHLRGFLFRYLTLPPGIPDAGRGHIFLTRPNFLRRGDLQRPSVKTSDGARGEIMKCLVACISWVTMKQAVVVFFQNAVAGSADIFTLLNIPGVGTVHDAATRSGMRGVDRATRP